MLCDQSMVQGSTWSMMKGVKEEILSAQPNAKIFGGEGADRTSKDFRYGIKCEICFRSSKSLGWRRRDCRLGLWLVFWLLLMNAHLRLIKYSQAKYLGEAVHH